jgi:MFS transporter, NHS family, xanthosine permease
MGIKFRLTLMVFLQYFIWGSWLISLGSYLGNSLHFSGSQIGSIFATMGIASMFMPGLLGILADRWVNAERLMGTCHLIGSVLLFSAASVTDPNAMYVLILLYAMTYMPTIALSNTVSYYTLENKGLDIISNFPPIRVWGTIGFIAAMWVVDLMKWGLSPTQLYLGSAAAIVLAAYSFTMPSCPPLKLTRKRNFFSSLGFDAFVLFKQRKMAIFFIFTMLLGAALQVTNTFGQSFLHDFSTTYSTSFAVVHPGLLMSISQISETLFILTIPFFLNRFGIKKVILISIFAWVARFALFGIGNPGEGLFLLILSMIIYGIAFDFFLISGSLYVETETEPGIRGSAQGLFMIMANGIGAFIGATASGKVIDFYTVSEVKDWRSIWFVFAGYAMILAIAFLFIFRAKTNRGNFNSNTQQLVKSEANLQP